MKKQTTQKQIEANRQNAKLGGVKTAKGKSIVRYNAIKHGLLTKAVFMKGENDKTLLTLERGLKSQIQPVGAIESMLTERVIANVWRLRRLFKIEADLMFEERLEEDFLSLDVATKLKVVPQMMPKDEGERLVKYEAMIERSIYRALHELQRIQSARLGERPPVPLSIDIDVSKGE